METLGTGHILEYGKRSVFTLDGEKSTPEDMARLVVDGIPLSVVVRYTRASGKIGRLDAMSAEPMPAISLKVTPESDLPLPAGVSLEVKVPRAEIGRLDLRAPSLMVPGIDRPVPMQPSSGGFKAIIPTPPGCEWRRIPIYLVRADGAVLRGKSFGLTSSGPALSNPGPIVAPAALRKIPCWIEVKGPPDLLDHRFTRVTGQGGAVAGQPVVRPGRIDFWLEVPGPGIYWAEVRVQDKLGRRASCLRAVECKPLDEDVYKKPRKDVNTR